MCATILDREIEGYILYSEMYVLSITIIGRLYIYFIFLEKEKKKNSLYKQ